MTHYYTSYREEISSGNTLSFLISNGAGSPYVASINLLVASGEGPADLDMYENVNIDSSGTSVPVRRNVTNPSGFLKAEHGGSYSGRSSDPYIQELVTGSSVGKIGGRTSFNGGEVVTLVKPEENILIDITNTGTNANKYNILVKMSEHDEYTPGER